MASFPASLPSIPTSSPGDILNVAGGIGHTALHNLIDGEILAVATKIGTGVSAPTANTVLRGNGTGTSTWGQLNLATDVTGQLSATNASNVLQAVYPVGCVYIETTGTNPNTTFGFGTWVAYGTGQTLIGVGTSDQAFAAGATGGESNHTLTSNEMPSHTHTATVTDGGHTHGLTQGSGTINTGNLTVPQPNNNFGVNGFTNSSTTGITVANSSTGSGAAHNNLPPYVVTYFWKRTA